MNTPKYSQYALHFPGYRADEKLVSRKRSVLSLVVETSAFFPEREASQDQQSFLQTVCLVLKPILDLNLWQGI